MKRSSVGTIGVGCLGVLGASAYGALPAFPGALGAGAQTTTGGRGGSVYHVTNLAADHAGATPGSLAFGLNSGNFAAGPRTIVFDVGGTIDLGGQSLASTLSTSASNITIAGATAPSRLNIIGGGLSLSGNNVVVRDLSIRPRYGSADPNNIIYTGLTLSGQNMIADHMSLQWASDYGLRVEGAANQVSVQNSIIAEGLNYNNHSYGALVQGAAGAQFSLHHNLFSHNKSRNVYRPGTSGGPDYLRFENNLVYDFDSAAGESGIGQSATSILSNEYIGVTGSTGGFRGGGTGTQISDSTNAAYINLPGTAVGTAILSGDYTLLGGSSFPGTRADDTPARGLDQAQFSRGARWEFHDATDARLTADYVVGTGFVGSSGPAILNDVPAGEYNAIAANAGTPTAIRAGNFDTDADGVSDAFERVVGMNPSIADHNGDYDTDGYTNLEEYLNDLTPTPLPYGFLTWQQPTGRYALSSNFTQNQEPSRLDVVQVVSGAPVVDAFGQRAKIIFGTGLVVQSGRLDVQALQVTTLTQTGGTLVVGSIEANTIYSLTGGRLQAGAININFINTGGTLAPAGKTTISGTYTQSSAAALEIDIASTVPTNGFDNLEVGGAVNLGGQLRLVLASNFNPTRTDTFTIITATGASAAVNGSFANANAFGLYTVEGGRGAFRLTKTSTSVILNHYTAVGDVNLDGAVNNADITSFIAALTGGPATGEQGFAADINGSGNINNNDIAPFVVLLTAGAVTDGTFDTLVTLVPEPALLSTFAFGGLLLTRRRRVS